MILDATQSTSIFSSGSQNQGINDKVLGKNDFLKMLVAQLHYQDPLNPTESTDFSAQLAQFSSVEQLENISGNLESFIDANFLLTTSVNNTMAANIIGKNVKAAGNMVYYNGQDPVNIPFKLSQDAASVEIKIYDANGNLVQTLNGENMSSGDQFLAWDGMDSNGINVSSGNYTIEVNALDSEGNAVISQTYISGEVTGIKYTDQGAMLLLGNLEISFSDVWEIYG